MYLKLPTNVITSIQADSVDHLRRTDEHSEVVFAGKVGLSLHRSIVLAFRFIQLNADPLAWLELSLPHVAHRPNQPFV